MKSTFLTLVFGFLTTLLGHAANVTQKTLPPGEGKQPQVAVSPDGAIYVIYGKDTSIYVTSSTDHGATFSAPVKVGDVPGLLLGMRRGPRIAATADRVLVTAPGSDLESFISTDKGASWTKIGAINDKSGAASEGLQNITTLPDGSFYAVWLDARTGSKQVEGSSLAAGAKEWSPNATVAKSSEKTVCECCHPTVVSDDKGKLVVMFRNSLAGNRDLYLTQSVNGGETFRAPDKLGTGSWKMNACPMDGGNAVASSDAGISTIWRRENTVFLDEPGKPETRLGEGQQPVIARISGNLYFAWQKMGNVVVMTDSGATSLGQFPGGYPSFAASPDGKEGYLVWESVDLTDMTPKFAVVQ